MIWSSLDLPSHLHLFSSAVGLPDEILLSTRNPPSLLSFSWSGDVKGASLMSDVDFYLDPKECT